MCQIHVLGRYFTALFFLLKAKQPCFSAIHSYEQYLKIQQYNAIWCHMLSASINNNKKNSNLLSQLLTTPQTTLCNQL